MLLLGLDIGTSGAKALIIDPARGGVILGMGAATYPLHTPRPLWAEEDPDDWWDASVASIRQAIQQSGADVKSIGAVGLSGQMQGAVLLDEAHRPVRKALLWCDQRTGDEAAAFAEKFSQARVIELTANPILMGSTASKILWLRKHEPETFARIQALLLPKDYIRLKLTGERATDVSDASATALFDVGKRAWSPAMVEAIGVPQEWLPRAYESAEVTAKIRPEAAEATGLASGTIVVAGAGDDASSAVGCGAIQPGLIASSIGTSAVLMAVSAQPVPDPKMRVDMFCHAVPNQWQTIGATLTAGASLKWFKDTFAETEQRQASQLGANIYDLLCREALSVPAGCEGLVFLPHLSGMRTPEPNPYTTGAFFGITLRHGKLHFLRAVLEGVAFALRDSLEIFAELGVPIKHVYALGGGGQNKIWRQIQADVLSFPHSTVNVSECAALGAALLAGVGAGVFASVPEACSATIRTLETDMPSQQNLPAYEYNYRLYRSLLRTVYKA